MASEKKQRVLSKQLITTEIAAGGEEVKPSAMAYVPYLSLRYWNNILGKGVKEKETSDYIM